MYNLRVIAQSLDVPKELSIYENLDKSDILGSYSHSLENHISYDAKKMTDRIGLLDMYSDGTHPVNMIALDDAFNSVLPPDDMLEASLLAVELGFVPFVGRWEMPDGFFAGISIAVNHGISDPDVMTMLKKNNQMFAARISRDGLVLFP